MIEPNVSSFTIWKRRCKYVVMRLLLKMEGFGLAHQLEIADCERAIIPMLYGLAKL